MPGVGLSLASPAPDGLAAVPSGLSLETTGPKAPRPPGHSNRRSGLPTTHGDTARPDQLTNAGGLPPGSVPPIHR
jgi:hypothetical protein